MRKKDIVDLLKRLGIKAKVQGVHRYWNWDYKIVFDDGKAWMVGAIYSIGNLEILEWALKCYKKHGYGRVKWDERTGNFLYMVNKNIVEIFSYFK